MNRYPIIVAFAAAPLLSTGAPKFARSQEPPADVPAEVDLPQLLDAALADLRVAESKGENAKAAFDRAGVRVRQALTADPGNLRAKYYQGRLLVLAEQEARALDHLVAWTKSREGQNDPEAHRILGDVYYRMQFYKLAKPVLETAIELDPRAPESYILLARCESKLVHRKEAIDRVQEAIQLLGPRADADTYLLLTEVLLLNKQVGMAERAVRFAKELAQSRVRETGGDAKALRKLDECITSALSVVQLKVRNSASDPQPCQEMSTLLQEQAQVSALTGNLAAMGWLQEALRRSGDRPSESLLVSGARQLLRLGKRDEAQSWLDRAIALYPNSSEVIELRSRLETAKPTEAPALDSRTP